MPETDYARARDLCRSLSDTALAAEYAKGPDGVTPDAWRALGDAFRERGLRLRPWADQSRIIVTTTPAIDGYSVSETLDVVCAERVIGLIFLSDVSTALVDPAGGRGITSEPGLRDARDACLAELREAAAAHGADAVIGMQLRYTAISPHGKPMLLIAASGTAVRMERRPG